MKKAKLHISCEDYLVSHEKFNIKTTEIPGVLKTVPTPEKDKIGYYYHSENYISHTDSNSSLIDKIYQFVKSYSIKKKHKIIRKYKPGVKTILDIGSGTGDFLSYGKKLGIDSVGTEPNEHARTLSIKKDNTVVENIDQLKGQKFDVVSMWHVFEHVHEPKNHLNKISALLNDDGLLVIAVPNYESYDAKHYKNFWAAYDVPRHIWHFNQKGMTSLLQAENYFVVKILPMKFDSFYVSLLSEKYKDGKKNCFKAFWVGLKSNVKAKKTKEYSSLIYLAKKEAKN